MEKGFLDKVEDNAAVQTWSETTQRKKCDSLAEGYVSESWDFTRISVTQNRLQELKEIWDQWNDEVKQLFYSGYGDLPYLLDIKKLINITGMSEQWVAARIKQKGDSKCIPWKNLKDLILAHPDTKKKVDVFTLSVYGLVVFHKTLRHIDEAVTDLVDRLDKKTQRMKRLVVGPMMTPEYIGWWGRSINDNVPGPSQGDSQQTGKRLRVIPFELEIIRQYFERRNSELEKKIEQKEEEKMNLRLDKDVQKLETKKLRKEKNKANGDLDSSKTDYKKLRFSMRTTRLGKNSEQWCQEIQKEKIKADRWERKFQEAQIRNETLKKSLSESRNEKVELKARVAELEKTLHQYQKCNLSMELRARLGKIEQMKRRVEELEMTLQNY
ncbi:hypothetical protein Goshw_012119 [Gossypium schwendimanii]|uniref:Uncharacterized protein n=1 Tax=Gossypium schwendimanii TaxID=34291 RepID=A0A7J9NDG6_GOSSC|nr:hypothetical protein [Gossypium schwendimanii]